MRTFDIKTEYDTLLNMMEEVDENGEFVNDEATLKELMDELDESKGNKLDTLELIKRDYEAKQEAVKAEIDRLTKRKKSFENQAVKLQLLQELLLSEEGFDTGRFKFSYRKSESVKVPELNNFEMSRMPKEWVITKYQFDKKAIKEDLKKGLDYSDLGIELVTNKSLQVR